MHNFTIPNEEHPINVAGVLKIFLNKLPPSESLFTPELRPHFTKICTIKDQQHRMATLHALLEKLPATNRETIREIARHMHTITLYEEHNKMNPTNLGASMGPMFSAVLPPLIEAISLGTFPPETIVYGVPLDVAIQRYLCRNYSKQTNNTNKNKIEITINTNEQVWFRRKWIAFARTPLFCVF